VEEVPPGDASPGLPHALDLLDTKPEVFHRYRSLARLKQQYRLWLQTDWKPDAILVCNFSPVFNAFIRWLKRQPKPPRIILYLADSVNLQGQVSWTKRLRYRFKPLTWLDGDMVCYMDACVAVSLSTEQLFAARNLPWLWLPNGCHPERAVRPADALLPTGPIRFGYFGIAAPHAGLPQLIKVFLARERQGELHICAFGNERHDLIKEYGLNPRLRFHEPRTPDGSVQLASSWDVLVNARPLWPGNECNFSSKVFEYALGGRAILTSKVSGVDAVLGENAYYFDEGDFDCSLSQRLDELAATPRSELRRRGTAIQERLLRQYSWAQQGEKLAQFLVGVVDTLNAANRSGGCTAIS
jgi:glycosyltransferase involved in cell wall biosynthesis